MKTLEKMVREVLRKAGYTLNPEVTSMEEVCNYIDTVNDERTDVEDIYTVEEWFHDTEQKFPEYLIGVDKIKEKYINSTLLFLIDERDKKVDIGRPELNLAEYTGILQGKDIQNYYKGDELEPDVVTLTVAELFNYLLVYWNEN